MSEEKEKTVVSLRGVDPQVLAQECVKILDEKKAQDIRLLRVEEQTILANYFVICTGTSNTQLRALAAEIEYRMTQAGDPPLRMEGYDEAIWIIVDLGCVIVHLFSRAAHEFYGLEKLWADAEHVDLSMLIGK